MRDVAAFPGRAAATRNFTLGRPRSAAVSPDGKRVVFLRSASGTDPVQQLWALDTTTGEERLLVDPGGLRERTAARAADSPGVSSGDAPTEDLPPEERARRERAREQAGGIVRYATDRSLDRAVFTLGTTAWLTDLRTGDVQRLPLDGTPVDPHLDPTGRHVAWVHEGSLRVTELDGMVTRTLVGEDTPDVTWGLAEFVAAEEMDRTRGFWWSPDGTRLLVTRVDTSGVERWWISQPVSPADEPLRIAYPAAGTANADVTLHVVGADGTRCEVVWDRAALPYLAAVHWSDAGPALVTVQSRDQRSLVHLSVDTGEEGGLGTGSTSTVGAQSAERWTHLTPGLPRWDDGRLVTAVDDHGTDTRRLAVDGRPVTPPGLHVREVVTVADGAAVVRASADDPTHVGLWRVLLAGDATTERLPPPDGVTSATIRAGVTVRMSSTLRAGPETTVDAEGRRWVVGDRSEASPLTAHPQFLELGPRRLRAALLRPAGAAEDDPLPVLLDPYGGPHVQRVLQAQGMYRTSQWFAELGFAVLIVDGRGTPGRGLAWEQAVHLDLAEGVLTDQVTALHAAAEHTALDLERVAVRGWSFGGYLAALAVLRRPDVFTAAIAGAPVTDWRLYDTHYTERYLGDPAERPDVYDRNSLIPLAADLVRPLLLIHGLADDNVVAAHTLRLSQALLEAGRPHEVLPLSGVTHMTPQRVVAENLLRLQGDFLRRWVLDPGSSGRARSQAGPSTSANS